MNAYVDDRPFSVDLAAVVRDIVPSINVNTHILECSGTATGEIYRLYGPLGVDDIRIF